MKKALLVTSVSSMIEYFNLENIKILQSLNYEVHVACNYTVFSHVPNLSEYEFEKKMKDMNVILHQVNFSRSPFSVFKMFQSYKEVDKILQNNFSIIHSQSPVGGFIGRIAARKHRKYGLKSLYTAHGFHFYQGAPLVNWLIYYPIEKILSRITDVLITINNEDFRFAKNKLKAKRIKKIPGIGLNLEQFSPRNQDKGILRKELELSKKSFIILSVGELNKNKNHKIILESLSFLKNKNIHYVICGEGNLRSNLMNKVEELGLKDQVHLLGHRDDINEINQDINLFAFPSKREGLGMAAIESMAVGNPILTSNIHGINDYSINSVTGYSCDPNDVDCFAKHIDNMYKGKYQLDKIRKNNIHFVKRFSKDIVNNLMRTIYNEV